MIITFETGRARVPADVTARVERDLRRAVSPFEPRVVRAALRIRRLGSARRASGWIARVSVSLGPAGVVRVQVRGTDVPSAARGATRRVGEAVARRLAVERQQLLELLFLATPSMSGGARERMA